MRRRRKPCEWCRTACNNCCTRGPIKQATHVTKWPEIRLKNGMYIGGPWKFFVCQQHAQWPSQPREAKTYPLRRL